LRIPDANVLLFARDTSMRQHATARSWVEQALSSTETVGFAVVGLLALIRIVTNPRATRAPLTPAQAFDQVEEWLGQPNATVLDTGPRHVGIWRSLVEASGTAGNLTTDAHLAALAIEHGATLATFDGDFHRFGGLKLEHLR
jgi:toxin-antitoxin system PIN domain toxin